MHKLKEGLTVKQAATEYEGQLLGVSPQVSCWLMPVFRVSCG